MTADLINKTQYYVPQYFYLSLSIFVFLAYYSFASACAVTDDMDECNNVSLVTNIIAMIYLTGLSIACIVLLWYNLVIYSQIDFNMLDFINQNECVDGPLRYAFKVTYD